MFYLNGVNRNKILIINLNVYNDGIMNIGSIVTQSTDNTNTYHTLKPLGIGNWVLGCVGVFREEGVLAAM